MELFTSSFGAWRPGMGSPVVASLTTPRWRPEAATWPRCWEITPRWAYFRAGPAEFDREYLAQLDRYGPQWIARRLAQIARDGYAEPSARLCIVCWEPSGDAEDCHRGLFREWLLAATGERIEEAAG